MRKLTDKEIEYLLQINETPLFYAPDVSKLIEKHLIQMSSGKVVMSNNLLDCKYCMITDEGRSVLEQQNPARIVRICSRIGKYRLVDRFLIKVPKEDLVEFLVSDDPNIRELAKERYE